MNRIRQAIRASGIVAIGVAALLLVGTGSAGAQTRLGGASEKSSLAFTDMGREESAPIAGARIDGISGQTSLAFRAMAGEISTPDGGSIHFWGYEDLGNNEGVGIPQYPGPTLILNQNDAVTITLTSQLPFGRCSSIVFPGHAVTATGGAAGLLTQESCGSADTVTYEFTASEPGTYMYHSGTEPELQIEMGLLGAIIVRPNSGEDQAYNADTSFDHEYMFLLTSLDPGVHLMAELGLFSQIDMTEYYPVYWMINGRAAPDDLADPFVTWLPHQPYNATPRMRPGEKLLMRIIGAGQGQHPFHFHGNNADLIARDGRLLTHPRSKFTTLSVPGETVDQIFTWTGYGLGWDMYGPVAQSCDDGTLCTLDADCADIGGGLCNADCEDLDNNMEDDAFAGATCHDANCVDTDLDGFDDFNWEYCPDHTKTLPVGLPEAQNLAFGGWWSGSPFMGDVAPLPPGEGGLNPFGGYFFMWHSHAEKELTNFDIFPGGMLSMMVVEPPYVEIP